MFLYCRKRKYEAELDSLVWKVNWDDIQTKGGQGNSQGFSMKSMVSELKRLDPNRPIANGCLLVYLTMEPVTHVKLQVSHALSELKVTVPFPNLYLSGVRGTDGYWWIVPVRLVLESTIWEVLCYMFMMPLIWKYNSFTGNKERNVHFPFRASTCTIYDYSPTIIGLLDIWKVT